MDPRLKRNFVNQFRGTNNLLALNEQDYNTQLQRVSMGEERYLAQNFEIAHRSLGNRPRFVEKHTGRVLITLEEVYAEIEKAHLANGHQKAQPLWNNLKTNYPERNVSQAMVVFYVQHCCPECKKRAQDAAIAKAKRGEKERVPRDPTPPDSNQAASSYFASSSSSSHRQYDEYAKLRQARANIAIAPALHDKIRVAALGSSVQSHSNNHSSDTSHTFATPSLNSTGIGSSVVSSSSKSTVPGNDKSSWMPTFTSTPNVQQKAPTSSTQSRNAPIRFSIGQAQAALPLRQPFISPILKEKAKEKAQDKGTTSSTTSQLATDTGSSQNSSSTPPSTTVQQMKQGLKAYVRGPEGLVDGGQNDDSLPVADSFLEYLNESEGTETETSQQKRVKYASIVGSTGLDSTPRMKQPIERRPSLIPILKRPSLQRTTPHQLIKISVIGTGMQPPPPPPARQVPMPTAVVSQQQQPDKQRGTKEKENVSGAHQSKKKQKQHQNDQQKQPEVQEKKKTREELQKEVASLNLRNKVLEKDGQCQRVIVDLVSERFARWSISESKSQPGRYFFARPYLERREDSETQWLLPDEWMEELKRRLPGKIAELEAEAERKRRGDDSSASEEVDEERQEEVEGLGEMDMDIDQDGQEVPASGTAASRNDQQLGQVEEEENVLVSPTGTIDSTVPSEPTQGEEQQQENDEGTSSNLANNPFNSTQEFLALARMFDGQNGADNEGQNVPGNEEAEGNYDILEEFLTIPRGAEDQPDEQMMMELAQEGEQLSLSAIEKDLLNNPFDKQPEEDELVDVEHFNLDVPMDDGPGQLQQMEMATELDVANAAAAARMVEQIPLVNNAGTSAKNTANNPVQQKPSEGPFTGPIRVSFKVPMARRQCAKKRAEGRTMPPAMAQEQEKSDSDDDEQEKGQKQSKQAPAAIRHASILHTKVRLMNSAELDKLALANGVDINNGMGKIGEAKKTIESKKKPPPPRRRYISSSEESSISSLSSSSEEEEDVNKAGPSSAIYEKKTKKKRGRPKLDKNKKKPGEKKKPMEKRKKPAPVLTNFHTPLPSDGARRRSSISIRSGRGYTGDVANSYICVWCDQRERDEDEMDMQVAAQFDEIGAYHLHLALKEHRIHAECQEVRDWLKKPTTTIPDGLIFMCEICGKQEEEFEKKKEPHEELEEEEMEELEFGKKELTVIERAERWQAHRMGEHGDEDPEENVVTILTEIERAKREKKAHPFLVKREIKRRVKVGDEDSDVDWMGNSVGRKSKGKGGKRGTPKYGLKGRQIKRESKSMKRELEDSDSDRGEEEKPLRTLRQSIEEEQPEEEVEQPEEEVEQPEEEVEQPEEEVEPQEEEEEDDEPEETEDDGRRKGSDGFGFGGPARTVVAQEQPKKRYIPPPPNPVVIVQHEVQEEEEDEQMMELEETESAVAQPNKPSDKRGRKRKSPAEGVGQSLVKKRSTKLELNLSSGAMAPSTSTSQMPSTSAASSSAHGTGRSAGNDSARDLYDWHKCQYCGKNFTAQEDYSKHMSCEHLNQLINGKPSGRGK